MSLDQIQIMTTMLYQGAFIFALLDIVLISILTRWVTPNFFIQMKWHLVTVAFLVWFGIWYAVLSIFWEDVYSYIFPATIRSWIPFIFGILQGLFSYIFWLIMVKIKKSQVVVFGLLTGLWGVITHIWAIYRGILTNPPMLRGVSPIAALVIAFFEICFYYYCIMILAMFSRKLFSFKFRKIKILQRNLESHNRKGEDH